MPRPRSMSMPRLCNGRSGVSVSVSGSVSDSVSDSDRSVSVSTVRAVGDN